MKARMFVAAALSLALALSFSAHAELNPQQVAEDLAARNNRMVADLKMLRADGALTEAAALKIMQKHAASKLDYPKLTRRAMGRHWRKADDAAREKLTTAFRALLENTYAKVLTGYSDQNVKLTKAAPRANGGVSATLEVSGATTAKIEYVCREHEGDYLVEDIKVQGISLVANYRRQFGGIIKKSGIDGLITRLQQMASERAPSKEQ